MRVQTNTVNSGNAKANAMPILSQAQQECCEGATTNADCPDRTMKRHERGAPVLQDEDIVSSSDESLSLQIKNCEGNQRRKSLIYKDFAMLVNTDSSTSC